MAYQVLARKWRPRRFDEVVGQDHVLKALTNALDRQRLHQAYLFSGTRGVGKTTLARLVAKALSCEQGVSARPCGECTSCREIDTGRYVDLIEVDAASRTRVDETRELLENVQYTPARGRYKVYLIDEVHMFSNHSFNALLKTLEEPPPHVQFLFATTEPKKLPLTVLSRCLQFNLKGIGAGPITQKITEILEAEGITSDAGALRLIAESAQGSLRDALSLLDQAINHGGGVLREAEVASMLGSIDRGQVRALLGKVVARDAAGVLDAVAQLADLAPDFDAVLGEILNLLQRVGWAQLLPAREDEDPEVRALADDMSPEDCQLFYQIALLGRRDLSWAAEPRQGLEMVLLRMLAFRPQAPPAASDPPKRSEGTPTRRAPAGDPAPIPAALRAKPAAAIAAPPAVSAEPTAWSELVETLELSGMVRELAMHSVPKAQDAEHLELVLPPAARHLRSEKTEARLEQALRSRYGSGFKLSIAVEDPNGLASPAERRSRETRERVEQARRSIAEDPNVAALRSAFGAEVEPGTVRPLAGAEYTPQQSTRTEETQQ
ncbi:MAG: DNA polymerase III subunit gamma/tau [Gammaproteobacteria bacterium]